MRPVSEYMTLLAQAVIRAGEGKEGLVSRSIANSPSLLELSFQFRLIWEEETAPAVNSLGVLTVGSGAVPPTPDS